MDITLVKRMLELNLKIILNYLFFNRIARRRLRLYNLMISYQLLYAIEKS